MSRNGQLHQLCIEDDLIWIIAYMESRSKDSQQIESTECPIATKNATKH